MVLSLGRLVSVPLREVWAHEAQDFTPWLAQAENLALLTDTLQLGELQLQGTEVPVGNFSIDILARDIQGRTVVIENQFGQTNHTHLGQILTYVAGQDGHATIIWVAEQIREEHRAAIDWLNAATTEGFDFFAVEVEALRIGASAPAPRFNIVAKPNDWSRGVARASRTALAGPANEERRSYMAYWSRFGAFLNERRAAFKLPDRIPPNEWCSFGRIAQRSYTLFVFASLRTKKRTVALYIGHRNARPEFELLEQSKSEIEAEFGIPLQWRKMPKTAQIEVNRPDLADADEVQQFEWFLDQLERFARVFPHWIEGLKLDEISADSNGSPQFPPAE